MTRDTTTPHTAPRRARIVFNPFGAEFRRDPYPLYNALRTAQPVHRTLGMWVLTRYADVHRVLRDRSFSAALIPDLVGRQADRLSARADLERIERLGEKSLVFTDNPDHARLRGLVNRVFTARAVARLRPLVETIAERLVRPALDDGGMDVVADVAAPLPVTVLCEWMALPPDLRERVGPWTHDIRSLLEPGLMKAADMARVRGVVERFSHALEVVLAHRRAAPGDDLISELLAARTGGGDRLSDEEITIVCIMCFVAGNETTTCLISNGMLAMLRHPDELARLRRRPELVTGVVTETLRYDSPLQLTKRRATRDVELGGQAIRAGDQVLLCLGAANRDPAMFARPDLFDIARFDTARGTTGHLGFGAGMHGCLGGLLAELQATVAFEHLLLRTGRLELLTDDVEWQNHSFIVRGPKQLPVALG